MKVVSGSAQAYVEVLTRQCRKRGHCHRGPIALSLTPMMSIVIVVDLDRSHQFVPRPTIGVPGIGFSPSVVRGNAQSVKPPDQGKEPSDLGNLG